MGQCYSVYFKYKVKDEKAAIKAIADYAEKPDYNDNGLDELMEHFYCAVPDAIEDGWKELNSGFDACYSWSNVMEEVVDAIAPYLEDESYFYCEPEEGSFECDIFNGKPNWTYKEYTEEQALENDIYDNTIDEYLDKAESYLENTYNAKLIKKEQFRDNQMCRRYQIVDGHIVNIYYDLMDMVITDMDIDF